MFIKTKLKLYDDVNDGWVIFVYEYEFFPLLLSQNTLSKGVKCYQK